MSWISRFSKPLSLAIIAVFCLLASHLLSRAEFFQTLEWRTVDLRFRWLGDQQLASPDIVLVEIDDASVKVLEEEAGRWPWPRDVHALFLGYMREAGARLVVFDLLFTEPHERESDLELARATREAGNVIHIVHLGTQDTGEPPEGLLERFSIPAQGGFMEFIQAAFPLAPVAESSRALGHVAMTLDPDGPWRRSMPLAGYRGRLFPSLGLVAALAAQNLDARAIRLQGRTIQAGRVIAPLDTDWQLPIWFHGGPGTYQAHSYGHVFYSAVQIFEYGEDPLLDPSLFKDKLVLVGLNATGLYDMFTTPYSGGIGDEVSGRVRLGMMPGVEIHANILDSLLHNRYLIRTPGWASVLLAVGVVLFSLLALLYLRITVAAAVCGFIPLTYVAAALGSFAWHQHLPLVSVILGWGQAVILGFAYQYWIEGAEKRKVKQIFSRYVSRDVYDQLLSNPEAAALGGKRAVVTVFFSDLRGFTSLSEKTSPEAIIAQLNEYFSEMVDVVFQHRGTIDKFVGDMIMALFNAPLQDPLHADHAVQCAVAMHQRLEALNRRWTSEGRPALECGIGINTGDMIVGNVGAESIRSYTVLGDNVNLGARLESLCKEYQARIIISEFTLAALRRNYPMKELGAVTVKGKSRSVQVFEVLVLESGSAELQPEAERQPAATRSS